MLVYDQKRDEKSNSATAPDVRCIKGLKRPKIV